MEFLLFVFFLKLSLTINAELTTAQVDKNKECRQLKRAIELKDGQITSLEEVRKKDEGKDSLPSSHPTIRRLLFCSVKHLRWQFSFL